MKHKLENEDCSSLAGKSSVGSEQDNLPMYHMFLLSVIRVRPSPTVFASIQPNYLQMYHISCKITQKGRRERSLPCCDIHGLIEHVKRIYNNNNNNN